MQTSPRSGELVNDFVPVRQAAGLFLMYLPTRQIGRKAASPEHRVGAWRVIERLVGEPAVIPFRIPIAPSPMPSVQV